MNFVADQGQSAMPDMPAANCISDSNFERGTGWRALIDLISEGMAIGEVIRDSAGKVVNFRFTMQNKAADRLTGVSAAEVVGKLGDQLLPTEYGLWVEIFDRAVTDRLIRTYQHQFPNDSRRWNVSIVPFGGERFAVLYTQLH